MHFFRKHKRLMRFAAFAAILCLLLQALSLYLDVYKDKVVSGRLQNEADVSREPAQSLDLLVIGDSESITSVSPMVLWRDAGIAGYIIGQSSQQITESYIYLQTAMKRQEPKMVLMETNMLFRRPDDTPDALLWFNDKAMKAFSVFKFHDAWKNILDPTQDPEQNYYKGFDVRTAMNPYQGNADYMKTNRIHADVSPRVQAYAEDIADLCRQKGIRLVFYTAPSPVNASQDRHQAALEMARRLHVPYYDLNMQIKELGMNWNTDTTDRGDHLNIAGATKVSHYLSKLLVAYGLPDRRGQAGYESWNEKEKDYMARMAQIQTEQDWQTSLV